MIFVAPSHRSAAGYNTGADCADAYAYTFFNYSGNWGRGSLGIGPGTTVHLCGTITSQLAAQGSGALASPITILFEANAKISVPVCSSAYGCLNLGSNSYITVDGGANGIVESSSNGTGNGVVTAVGAGTGGIGYAANDILTLSGGNGAGTVRVLSSDGSCASITHWVGGLRLFHRKRSGIWGPRNGMRRTYYRRYNGGIFELEEQHRLELYGNQCHRRELDYSQHLCQNRANLMRQGGNILHSGWGDAKQFGNCDKQCHA